MNTVEEYLSRLTSNSQTKPFWATSEFLVFLATEAALIAEAFPMSSQLKGILVTAAAIGYKLSRGAAKSGSTTP